jgi:hypothetical protein
MQRKAAAHDEIRRLQAEIVDLDRAHAAVDRDREIATRAIVQGDYVLRGWSEATVPDWDRAVDVLRDAMTALGLKMAVAGPALIQYMDPPARRLTGFRAAIMRPPVLDKNTYKNVRGR